MDGLGLVAQQKGRVFECPVLSLRLSALTKPIEFGTCPRPQTCLSAKALDEVRRVLQARFLILYSDRW
jgi:hypothetical protein